MKIKFLGAAGQVTGSSYFLDLGSVRLLVDCGMHQEREFKSRNWEKFAVDPGSIDAVLLTHAHLDHSGLLPKLVREGFRGTIYTTAPSRDLAAIIMEDSARIQIEDAAQKRKRHKREGRKSRFPVQPLYEIDDVNDTLELFETVNYAEPVSLGNGVTVTYHDAGHILGSAILELRVDHDGEERTIVFSGDLGQHDKPIINDPTYLDKADYLIMESTYGDSLHKPSGNVEDRIADVINETVERGGNVIIPTFAVERAQELMFHIGTLVRADRIPNLMVFLDSPMAVDATEVFRKYTAYMDEEVQRVLLEGDRPLRFSRLNLVRSTNESKAINRIHGSCIVLAGSGMCTAGRIKHHLVRNITRPESSIVFVGYQAQGTLGREIKNGEKRVRILGQHYDVRARIVSIDGLSAHADREGLIRWARSFRTAPRKTFLTHGEPHAAQALAESIKTELGRDCEIPEYRSEYTLA